MTATQTIQQYKPVTAVDLEKKVEEYIKQLAEETGAVQQSAWFKEYLDTMAKFWRYSLNNQILIHIQKRDATRVAGFRTWNETGRRIKAGQKAIKILAPFTKKVVQKDVQTGEEKEVEFTYFCPVSVFDVSQTEGRDLPRLDIDIEGNSHQALLEKLVEFCKTRQIEVEFKPLGINGLYGYSQGGKIVVGTNQSPNMQVNTLVHEIAHELMHSESTGQQFTKNEQEIQAESVAYVVCKVFGLETKSSMYITLYENDSDKIQEQLKEIAEVTKVILKHLVNSKESNLSA
ncbi:MAG: ArdC-like ssDNA-binding domain-containing protein [Candidatus Micrarchaeota archaeon]